MNVLMCKPSFYNIEYEINPWMNVRVKADTEKAVVQWRNLYQILQSLGVNIKLIEAQEKLPDMVFTANAGLVIGKRVYLAQFKHPERQGETPFLKNWFMRAGYEVVDPLSHTTKTSFEGEGDALFMGNKLFVSYGIRSDRDYYENFQQLKNIEVIPCELIDPYFYHLDTCFSPLNNTLALWWPQAFAESSKTLLQQHVELIAVPEDEARRFACNVVVINQDIVIPEGCNKTKKRLESIGYRVHPTAMTEYIKSGGACKCLTLYI